MIRLLAITAALLCGGCASSYSGPAPGQASAEISFTALEGEKAHTVTFGLVREISSENCLWEVTEKLAHANVGRSRFHGGESAGLSAVRIPADRAIKIRLAISYASFGDKHKMFDVAFTPAPDVRYRLDVEWDRDYINVRLLELGADGGIHKVPFRLEECRIGLLSSESVPVEPG